MNLYEVRNGYMGESYVRVYVWCEGIDVAREMASKIDEKWQAADELEVEFLFSEHSVPFITLPSDSGWFMP